ncbi:MAG TPA: hypothetical protein VH000_12260 [Rhizomicrobium sp.]|nr:hypothetical protein [Rhizomicrobium sp.]
MKRFLPIVAALAICATAAHADDSAANFKPTAVTSSGSVTTAAGAVDYQAIAGTLVVHPKEWSDVRDSDNKDNPDAEASMFYVAYFKNGAAAANRPITFLFNGGPGSSSVWVHMGAFGPKRVLVNDDTHTPAAPYSVVNNDESLLDVSDLVFIDAPGTGFSRIAGKDKEKSFYGVDQDIHAYASFIQQFLSKYNRWNSPKYLFGESYGTMRSAGLAYALQNEGNVDLNGVILLSQVLNWDSIPDQPEDNPGVDLPYQLALPSYAATAWYHHMIPNRPNDLPAFLHQVEQFDMNDYALALARGNSLEPARRAAIAQKLHDYTGLPVAYILKANLRISYGPFQQQLLADAGLNTGTLDTRFKGPSLDPLAKSAEYDPQSAAISSAYVAAFNGYVRQDLHYGEGLTYNPEIDVYTSWDYKHQPPDAGRPIQSLPNVMPDLATAMKQNPTMKVLLNGGYFDLSTPYYEGWFEMHHMAIPPALQKNIEYRYYQSGHMVYVHLPALKALHDNVAAFIAATSNQH